MTDDDFEADLDLTPTDAFSLLADPDRFGILAALAEAPLEHFHGTLTFSELRERSDIDDSGRFNYHLDRLVGPFLRRTEEGYALRHAGRIVYRLAVSGMLTRRGQIDPVDTGASCLQCGGRVVGAYEGDRFRVACEDCERRVAVTEFPPGAAAHHSRAGLVRAFDRYLAGMLLSINAGVCHWCAGPLAPAVVPADEDWPAVDWLVTRDCACCDTFVVYRLGDALRHHPDVVAFFHDRGLDLLEETPWDFEQRVGRPAVTVTETEPWRGTVEFSYAGDQLHVDVDADAAVRGTEVDPGSE